MEVSILLACLMSAMRIKLLVPEPARLEAAAAAANQDTKVKFNSVKFFSFKYKSFLTSYSLFLFCFWSLSTATLVLYPSGLDVDTADDLETQKEVRQG